jgi:hypothetical protein
MDRFETDPTSTVFDRADFPGHPYSGRAPYDGIWVTVAEVSPDRDGGLDRSEPTAWGTLGECMDINIEPGSVGPDEMEELASEVRRDGKALLAGHVGCGFEVVRIEGPDAVPSSAPAP